MLSKINKKKSILIFLMTLLPFAIAVISSNVYADSNPLLGKWGYVILEHGLPTAWFTWKTEAGTITFNSDGTAVTTYAESADNCPDEHYCMSADTGQLTYSVNPDGTFTIYIEEGHGNGVVSSDGKMLIMNGTTFPDSQGLMWGVRLDTTRQYSNSDVSGDYFSIAYERDNLGGSKGYNRAESTITSMDGAGNSLRNRTLNGDGIIITVTNESGIYSVHSDGSITLENVITGYASGDGKVAVFSNPTRFYPQTGDDFAAFIAMKRQDMNYSTSDLGGRWAYTAFGDRSGNVRSEFGTITCDSSGACQFLAKVLNADGQITDKQKSITISIQPDGSYNGFFLSGAMPHTSGALGNDGNTMFLVMNEDNTSTNDRLIGVAIKTGAFLRGMFDFDGDGKTDVSAFHLPSDQFFTDYAGNLGQYGWGGSDCYPLIWDYDGDGATEVSIYHIPTNQWFVKGYPGDNLGQFGWGGSDSVPVPGDYNGDGVMERAFYHSPTNRWFVEGQDPVQFGWNGAECIPVPGDYDGDGKTDMALYHVPSNQWFLYGVGNLGQFGWGGADCIPVPGDYNGDGETEIAIYHVPSNQWFWRDEGGTAHFLGQYGWGGLESFPIPGDYDGDGVWERGFYRPSNNWWFIEGEPDFYWGWDGGNFIPITSQIAVYNWFRFVLGKFQ